MQSAYPERYLTKIKNYIAAENVGMELEHETKWMVRRLEETEHAPANPVTVRAILSLMRENCKDIPFIQQYIVPQMEGCSSKLVDDISSIHQSWFGYLTSLQALNHRITNLKNFKTKYLEEDKHLLPPFDQLL